MVQQVFLFEKPGYNLDVSCKSHIIYLFNPAFLVQNFILYFTRVMSTALKYFDPRYIMK